MRQLNPEPKQHMDRVLVTMSDLLVRLISLAFRVRTYMEGFIFRVDDLCFFIAFV